MPTTEQLEELQSKPLKEKIQISSARIIEWYETWGGQVYVSFSGGKDSVVLLHLVRRLYPNALGVYIDTGLEYPELRDFVKKFNNIRWLQPQKYDRKTRSYKRYTFTEVLKDYGYPIISKEQAAFISEYRNTKSEKLKDIRLNGNKYGMGKISKKYRHLIDSDFLIGDKCCDYMKKHPAERFEKETGLKPIIGTMTYESKQRESNWKMYGCNAFNKKRPTSSPISFWTEQDILCYIKEYNLEYAPVYGNLVESEDGTLHFTKCQRTGCIFCGFGCQVENNPNRFQRLAETHPKLYDYCINGGQYNENGVWQPGNGGLGMGHVLDELGVDYHPMKEGDEQ